MTKTRSVPAPIIPDRIVERLRLRPYEPNDPRKLIDGKLVGWWRSHQIATTVEASGPYANQDKAEAWAQLPWPGDHIDPSMPACERERIAALLDAAPQVSRFRGVSWDRLDPGAGRVAGNGERSAVGWIWPMGLSHYVRTYGLVLPPEMVADLERH